jgi:peptidoglycan/xylan/chitin deacetylase (PgdA/CDA1 family)
MKNNQIFKILRYTGLPFFFRQFLQRKKVTILLFHSINKAAAEKSFVYLSKKYNIIALKDFLDAVQNQGKLPERALIITFDDGHVSNYDLLPEIIKRHIPVTIFLCSAIVNTNRHFWFLHESISGRIAQLKKLSNNERLAVLSENGFTQELQFDKPQALNKEQIDEMKTHVDFQSHTMFHPVLPRCTDAEARKEIFESKQQLEEAFQLNINTISYPNGDYSVRDIQMAKAAGYSCGITVDYGFNTTKTDLFRLKRISVNDTDDMDELIVKASGVWAFLKTRNGRRQAYGFSDKTEA